MRKITGHCSTGEIFLHHVHLIDKTANLEQLCYSNSLLSIIFDQALKLFCDTALYSRIKS